ncbi:MAG: asparaginase [Thermoleophilia bacterium]|nr:asparaginase [Gaiellaceae bacterium]MDW8338158.1 asparaginase [Thermoleophilia bacterium]
MGPIVVEVIRGAVVEARHRVHAVAVSEGTVVAQVGDPALVTWLRSAAKPLQALPIVRARRDLTDAEVAIVCASHRARPEQLEVVRSLLAKAGATEDDLACGRPPRRIEHDCSGKHAGMLALCAAAGWSKEGFERRDHPCQRAMLAEVAAATGALPEEIPTASDGCGVLTYAFALERIAAAFSRFHTLDGALAVTRAMVAHPELVRGRGAADTVLMQAHRGWIAKGGAEGLLVAASPDGLGLALKVEDGAGRAVGPALAAFLSRLGLPLPALERAPVETSRGEAVGQIRVSPSP